MSDPVCIEVVLRMTGLDWVELYYWIGLFGCSYLLGSVVFIERTLTML